MTCRSTLPFLLPFLCIACRSEKDAHPNHALPISTPVISAVDTLSVNISRSVIQWKGTKFWGLGQHEGTIRLAPGEVYIRHGELTGGTFTIDMNTIEVTDIPEYETIPRRRLRNHLMDDDFFAVATYPTARFFLTEVAHQQGTSYAITGQLTLRGQTHPVAFDADLQFGSDRSLAATAAFHIDRQRWGVAYRGSRLTNDLVDDEIHLRLELLAARAPR